jgi:hypothetical protein
MKSAKLIVLATVAVIGLYGFGYWAFIRRGLVSKLPSAGSDPFDTSGLRGTVQAIFRPARELDLRLTVDARLRKQLIGNWKAEPNNDFVRISPDLACKFRLGRFAYEGPVKFERDYAGYFTEFRQDDTTYVFIFSIDSGIHAPDLPENVAIGFVGHDPTPGFREADYDTQLTKQANPGDEANRLPDR